MNNLLKSKTRLTFIQIIFENLSTKNDIFQILKTFELNYKSTFVQNFHNKEQIKFEFNTNYLNKLITFYDYYTKNNNYFDIIDSFIDFNRSFKNWDIINQSILLGTLSEIKNIEKNKIKVVLNDYLNIGKSFIDDKEIGTINAILDKIIYEKK
jgi:transcription termination factor NusB